MDPACYHFNPPAVHALYLTVGTVLPLYVFIRFGLPTLRTVFPYPAKIVRYPTLDAILFVAQLLVVGYNFYTRHRMGNLATAFLPCHLGLCLSTLLVSPLQDHRALWLAFGALFIPFAGGGSLGMMFRDRRTWSSAWVPPYYDEVFYVEHIFLTVFYRFYLYFKLQCRGDPFRLPSCPLRYTFCVVVPAWMLLHRLFLHPLALFTGFNLEYVLCPHPGFKRVPVPPAAWSVLYEAVPPIVGGYLYYFWFELPLTFAVMKHVFRMPPVHPHEVPAPPSSKAQVHTPAITPPVEQCVPGNKALSLRQRILRLDGWLDLAYGS